MSTKTFTIHKAYVLSAINKKGERVYYDTDSHSGGWPFWSTFGGKEFRTLDKVPTIKRDSNDYMSNEVTTIEVLEVTHKAKVIQTTELVSEARAKAEAEIAKIQKELAQKIAMLEGVK